MAALLPSTSPDPARSVPAAAAAAGVVDSPDTAAAGIATAVEIVIDDLFADLTLPRARSCTGPCSFSQSSPTVRAP